jgi:branched-subunit amino acid transport protein
VTAAGLVAAVLIGLGTVALRGSVVVLAEKMGEVPPRVTQVLRMIPAASLAALVTPALFRPAGAFDLLSPELLAGVLALLVAWRTKNLFLTIVVGLVAVALLGLVL